MPNVKPRRFLYAVPGKRTSNLPRRSVMFRELSGEIQAWDRSSEIVYGYPRSIAVGTTSHRLLKTIFPEPLANINIHLLNKNRWKGELIHTLSGGQQVKVVSEWEVLEEVEAHPIVRETNTYFSLISPETAQLKERSLLELPMMSLIRKVLLINLTCLVSLGILGATIWLFTHPSALQPLP